jgi:zinc/manganese transport system substrate-binding protein
MFILSLWGLSVFNPTVSRPRRRVLASLTAVGAVTALAVSACSTTAPGAASAGASASGGKIVVVAAENFWGSIAAQLGGSKVSESAINTNPDTDPHSYEATASDARTIAGAQLFVQNGIGYDTSWAPGLVSANPNSARTVLTVGDVLGLKGGDNPHQWYSHTSVYKVIDAITAAYQKIDPADASYFAQQKTAFEDTTLTEYNQLETTIKAKYAGTPIGASESIVSPLADSLGLDMLTPYSFLKDISEGTDPTSADKATIDQQIQGKKIKVYVYNSQNSTPDIQAQLKLAQQEGIPVTTVTETLSPAGDSFQQWMVGELQNLQKALAEATGH